MFAIPYGYKAYRKMICFQRYLSTNRLGILRRLLLWGRQPHFPQISPLMVMNRMDGPDVWQAPHIAQKGTEIVIQKQYIDVNAAFQVLYLSSYLNSIEADNYQAGKSLSEHICQL